jgi:hypothetical protein
MNLNQGRKILTDMQICFQQLELQFMNETEKFDDPFIANHLSFRSWYKSKNHLSEIMAFVAPEHDIVQLSMNFYSDAIRMKYPEVLELLNLINMTGAGYYWQIIPDYEKFEFRTAFCITDNLLDMQQFKIILKRMLKIGPVYYSLIHKYLNSQSKPKHIFNKFKSKNKRLLLTTLHP